MGGLLGGRGPAEHRLIHQGVLHVRADRHGRVDPRELLDREDGHEEAAAAAPVGRGDLDPHHPEREERVDEGAWDLSLPIHSRHERAHLRLGEPAHRLPEERLVVPQPRQRRRARLPVRHRGSPFAPPPVAQATIRLSDSRVVRTCARSAKKADVQETNARIMNSVVHR